MNKWLVYKCLNSPVERMPQRVYHSDYEKSFDTKEAAENFIKQRNKKKKSKVDDR